MKNLVYISLLALLFASCGGSKKVVSQAPNTSDNDIVIHDTITIPAKEEIETQKEEITEDITVVSGSVEEVEIPLETPMIVEVFNHSVWQGLLSANVSEKGEVNYEGFRIRKGELREYITSLGVNMPTETWTQDDRLAYWMNAYNAMTIDLILRNLPLESIKDIDKPWNQRLWKLGDKWYNLDEIEHQILRKMDDPRIHFGINCASFSCPPILNEAFSSVNVDSQLDLLARRFVNDTERNSISASKIEISKIFNWFAKDFKKDGSLIDFLNKYSETTINGNARKSFKDYNWSLNN